MGDVLSDFDAPVPPPALTDPLARADLPQTDVGAAERLVALRGADLLFVHGRGWAVWDGARFDTEHGDTLALRVAQGLYAAVNQEADAVVAADITPREIERLTAEIEREQKEGVTVDGKKEALSLTPEVRARQKRRKQAEALRAYARTCHNSNRMKNALAQASAFQGTFVTPDAMDAAVLKVTLANGVLDLARLPRGDEAGVEAEEIAAAFGPHDRADRSTRRAAARFDPKAECPKFDAFMARIQPDPGLRAYLARVFGLCLSGSIGPQTAFLFKGEGANGKSTLLAAISHVLGDYAMGTPIESFLRDQGRSGGGPSPDLARLPGARLVRASEPERGAVLSESRIKAWCGGEPIQARKLHGEFFDFVPQGKLFLSFNRTPSIQSDDDGTWRRLHLIPFPVQIPPEERRPLEEILAEFAAEASGILNWMIAGWRDFTVRGLAPPLAVTAASAELRQSLDLLGQFLTDFCEKQDGADLLYKEFSTVFDAWMLSQGLDAWTGQRLGRALTDKGFGKGSRGRNKDRTIKGLRWPDEARGEARPDMLDTWLKGEALL